MFLSASVSNMGQLAKHEVYAAGIVERFDRCALIVLPKSPGGARLWRFPRGPVLPSESPEAAMRRIARTTLGLGVEVLVGQPPIVTVLDGQEITMRYFFCGVGRGEVRSDVYRESRWVSRAHLREYEFEESCRPVVEWLLQE